MKEYAAIEALDRSHASLVAGFGACAWMHGHSALAAARAVRSGHLETRALMALARAANMQSQVRAAYHLSSRAAAAFEAHGDELGCAGALASLGYAASMLGIGSVAAEASRRSVELSSCGTPVRRAEALNYSGVAAFWRDDGDAAARTLDAATWWASDSSAGSPFHPLVNRGFLEILRCFAPAGPMRGSDSLQCLADRLQALLEAQRTHTVGLVSPRALMLLAYVVLAFAAIGRGDDQHALELLGRFERESNVLPPQSWVHGLPWWVRCVRARSQGSFLAATHAARQMEIAATRGQHVVLARLATEHLAALGGLVALPGPLAAQGLTPPATPGAPSP